MTVEGEARPWGHSQGYWELGEVGGTLLGHSPSRAVGARVRCLSYPSVILVTTQEKMRLGLMEMGAESSPAPEGPCKGKLGPQVSQDKGPYVRGERPCGHVPPAFPGTFTVPSFSSSAQGNPGLCVLAGAIAKPWEVPVSSSGQSLRVPWLLARDPPLSAASLDVGLSCSVGGFSEL